jgi:carbamoyltransferase
MIIGINPSHDSCFCLLNEAGQPEYILEEERFNRIKHSGFGTLISLETLLREGLLNTDAVTDLVYSFEMGEQVEAELMKKCCDNVNRDFGPEVFREASRYFNEPEHYFSPARGVGLTTGFEQVKANIRSMFPRAHEASYMHHLCHAASAFYPSPFTSAAVLILDGSGRLETTTIWHAGEKRLECLEQIELPHSIGVLYWLFSHFVGLEEGQMMGLAAYGEPVFRESIYERLIDVDGDGNFSFKAPLIFWFDMDNEYATRVIEDLFGVPTRSSHHEPLTQFHANVAASIQCITEEALLKLASHARALTGERNLCLAGGVIQNCVANGLLVNERVFDEIWIQPMAHDAGSALGAALQHHFNLDPERRKSRWRMTTAQLGLGHSPQKTQTYLDRLGVRYRESANCAEETAQWLANGHIVGWFQGKAEVGPRALGGRSILADPRQKFNVFTLNEIKQRHPWRPFAPSILCEYGDEYVDGASPSPFMILSFPVHVDKRALISAVCHVDGSTRPQTVSPASSQNYFELLTHFNELTGSPLVLNTSFNLRDEPIVQHPLDAIRDFILSGIDRLVLDQWVVEVKPSVSPLLAKALAFTRFSSLYDHHLRDSHVVLLVEHDEFTEEQRRNKIYLEAILGWLRIAHRNIKAHMLGRVVSMTDSDVDLVSVAAYLDEQVLKNLSLCSLAKIHVSIIDHKMFMARTGALEFLSLLEHVRGELHRLISGREVILWAEQTEVSDLLHSLNYLGIMLTGFISDDTGAGEALTPEIERLSPSFLNGKAETMFLIVSFPIFDKFRAQIRHFGYKAKSDLAVWDA